MNKKSTSPSVTLILGSVVAGALGLASVFVARESGSPASFLLFITLWSFVSTLNIGLQGLRTESMRPGMPKFFHVAKKVFAAFIIGTFITYLLFVSSTTELSDVMGILVPLASVGILASVYSTFLSQEALWNQQWTWLIAIPVMESAARLSLTVILATTDYIFVAITIPQLAVVLAWYLKFRFTGIRNHRRVLPTDQRPLRKLGLGFSMYLMFSLMSVGYQLVLVISSYFLGTTPNTFAIGVLAVERAVPMFIFLALLPYVQRLVAKKIDLRIGNLSLLLLFISLFSGLAGVTANFSLNFISGTEQPERVMVWIFWWCASVGPVSTLLLVTERLRQNGESSAAASAWAMTLILSMILLLTFDYFEFLSLALALLVSPLVGLAMSFYYVSRARP